MNNDGCENKYSKENQTITVNVKVKDVGVFALYIIYELFPTGTYSRENIIFLRIIFLCNENMFVSACT